MNQSPGRLNHLLRRRLLLKFTAALGTASAYVSSRRSAFADFLPLLEPATPILSAERVFLIATARAGARLLAVGQQGVIVYSDDNGSSWAQAAVPVSVTLVAICFADHRTGWAAGAFGVVLKTADGGTTWQKCLDGNQVNALISSTADAFAKSNPGTTASARAVRRAGIFLNDGPDKPFLALLSISPKSVLAFGSYRMLMRSDDGGETWTDLSLAVADPISNNLYGAARIGDRIYVAAETGLVFCSTDGGRTFPQVTPAAQATLFGVCGTGGDGVLVYGVAGQAYYSQDHGNSWSASAINDNADLTSAGIVGNRVMVASEDGALFASTDQGSSFALLPGFSASMQINDFLETADGALLLVGNAGPQIVSI
jgi:photosystem II stability/assembly factor-like uncharacterized protein